MMLIELQQGEPGGLKAANTKKQLHTLAPGFHSCGRRRHEGARQARDDSCCIPPSLPRVFHWLISFAFVWKSNAKVNARKCQFRSCPQLLVAFFSQANKSAGIHCQL